MILLLGRLYQDVCNGCRAESIQNDIMVSSLDFSLFSLYFDALIFHSFHFSFFHNREQNDFSSFFANIIYKNGINYLNDKNSTFLNRRTTISNPFFLTVPNYAKDFFRPKVYG